MDEIFDKSYVDLAEEIISEQGPLKSLNIPDEVPEEIIDVRANHKLEGNSGAEAFFCDESECLIEKDKQLCMAGVKKEVGSQINKIIKAKIKSLNTDIESMNRLKDSFEEKKVELVYLLKELGYKHIQIKEFDSSVRVGAYLNEIHRFL